MPKVREHIQVKSQNGIQTPTVTNVKLKKNSNINETFSHAVMECDYVKESISYCMNALGLFALVI